MTRDDQYVNPDYDWTKEEFFVTDRRADEESDRRQFERELREEFETKYPEAPYDHCGECPLSYREGGPCKVADKYQRTPRRPGGMGGLGMCILIGGSGS